MALQGYRAALRTPGVPVVLTIGFLARIPFSTIGLLLTLHTVITLQESFFSAGLVVAASTLGIAIASPLRGRLLDRHGLRRAVLPSLLFQPLILAVATLVPYPALVLLALVGGLFAMPVFAIVRTSLSVLVPADQRRTVFSLDSVSTELVFMLGPAAATIAAVALGTTTALLVVAGLIVLAGIGIMLANPPTRSDQIMLPTRLPRALEAAESGMLATGEAHHEARVAQNLTTGQIPVIDERTGRPVHELPAPSVRPHLLTLGGLALLAATLVGSLLITATDLTVVAFLEGDGNTAAIAWVLAIWCAGSAIGGFVYGASARDIGPFTVLLALGVLSLPIAASQSVWMLAVTAFGAGLALAPIITATGEAIARRVPEQVRGEAMGWHGSALTAGAAVGAPLIGVVIDLAGPRVGILVGSALAIALALTGFVLRAWRLRRTRRRLAG